ncbi:hypothetical protein CHS0354_010497 [Potamilus streckersoni]|uniref:Uncharacterized protein n=1 Tax=Potamilus streckersoni TaxID=2493646 RepID=A0AAE0T5G2_9BIVA|nr:hypothetical protein CHS0354_010497 [Potamilus streckersoni]
MQEISIIEEKLTSEGNNITETNNEEENNNREMEMEISNSTIIQKKRAQMYLIEPPIDLNEAYCHDESETGCILAGLDRPDFCGNPNIRNHLCPKFCGTCGKKIVSSVGPK